MTASDSSASDPSTSNTPASESASEQRSPEDTGTDRRPINWLAVKMLYASIGLGIGWMLYWGDYRNAAWLTLIGTGGGLNLYGRLLQNKGEEEQGTTWQLIGGGVYAVFFLWAVYVLVQAW